MYCVKALVGSSPSTIQVLGPYTLEAAEEMVAQLARQQSGSQAWYAYVATWRSPAL